MTAVIFVSEGGARPWVTIGVAAIAATAALIGATVAAITAGRRQSRQLKHDRELADLTELRVVLDTAARNIVAADRTMQRAADRRVEKRLAVSDQIRDELVEAGKLVEDSLQQVRIRLGRGDVLWAYQEAGTAYTEFQSLVSAHGDGGDDQSITAARARFTDARDRFFHAAYLLVGVSVSHGAPPPAKGDPHSGRGKIAGAGESAE